MVFTLNAAKKTKAGAIKNKGTDQGLEYIVGKGGPAQGRKGPDKDLTAI